MKWMINGLRPHFLLGGVLCSIIFPSCVFATNEPSIPKFTTTTHTPGYVEVIGAGSLSNVRAGNGSLGVTNSETDTLQQTNNNEWNSLGAQLGLGYVYFLGNATEYSAKTQWFPMFEPQVNVYFNKYENSGNVLRFGNSANNELTYNMPIYSTRLMLDGALTIVSNKQYSTFVIAGIGNSWNRIGYKDYDGSGIPCTNQAVHLSNRSRSHFVWELGAGVAYILNDRANLSFEYLYTNYGRLETSGSGSTGIINTPSITPASFNLQAQAFLLGLHIAV